MVDSILDLHPEKVSPEPNSGCWLWLGSLVHNGYAQVRFRGRKPKVHRVSYTISCGEIPDGLHVLHKCDVRTCVNPDHLFLGTNADNVADKVNKGRQARGLDHGRPGELNGNCKLDENRVLEIRKRLEAGELGYMIAKDYGISKSTISLIRKRKIWSHI